MQIVDFAHDLLFHRLGPVGGSFVAAFLLDPQAGNVAAVIIEIARDPDG